MFSICVLCYGEYPELARRCLDSIAAALPYGQVQDLRIGLNAVSLETQRQVQQLCERLNLPCYVYQPPRNVGKYPLMRRMFYDLPLAEQVMWFDDDSYLLPEACHRTWWARLQQLVQQHPVTGQLWYISQRGQQYLGIARQPWYNARSVHSGHRFYFATGGWWVAQAEFLTRWDYPFKALFHNGGDSILGELVRQQGATLGKFDQGVVINEGRRQSRRGIGSREPEVYPWQQGTESWEQHNFNCQVWRYARREVNV